MQLIGKIKKGVDFWSSDQQEHNIEVWKRWDKEDNEERIEFVDDKNAEWGDCSDPQVFSNFFGIVEEFNQGTGEVWGEFEE